MRLACWWRTAWGAIWSPHGRHIHGTSRGCRAPCWSRRPTSSATTCRPTCGHGARSFGALAVTSDDDPFSAPERSARLVREWGAREVSLGAAGHVNGDSGLGDWPAGQSLLAQLLAPA
jgi:predicted alpha/beta hydrolase family esterase